MTISRIAKEVSIPVSLETDEYLLAITTGLNRAEAHPESTPYGKPAVRSHPEGAVGEMIVCKFFGANFDNTIMETGVYPGDTDLKLGDVQVDVKVSTYEKTPKLLVKPKLVEEGESDIYILVTLNNDGRIPPTGHIVGWYWSDELEEQDPIEFPPDTGRINYVRDWEGLYEMRYIDSVIPEGDDESQIVREPISDGLEHIDLSWLGLRESHEQTGFRDW